jgi:hypothetical protein
MRPRLVSLAVLLVLATLGAGCVAEPCVSGLAATPGKDAIVLSWGATSGATVYAIARGVDGGTMGFFAFTNETTLTDSNVTLGHTYSYSVGSPAPQDTVDCPAVTASLSDASVPFFGTAGSAGLLLAASGAMIGVLLVLLRRR